MAQHFNTLASSVVSVSVKGVGASGSAPGDPCGTAGLTHYVQVVNDRYAIFLKSTGQMLSGYTKLGRDLYASFNDGTAASDACRLSTRGDPVIQYDEFADRWIFSEFAFQSSSAAPWFQVTLLSVSPPPYPSLSSPFIVHGSVQDLRPHWCLLVLQLRDKECSWDKCVPRLWQTSNLARRYYMSSALFSASGSWTGSQVCGYNRANMLSGGLANPKCYEFGSSSGLYMVADLEGKTLPQLGSSSTNFVIGFTSSKLLVYKYSYTTNAVSGPTQLSISSFTTPTSITQPSPGGGLDALSDRLMYRVSYRNMGSYESIICFHTVQ